MRHANHPTVLLAALTLLAASPPAGAQRGEDETPAAARFEHVVYREESFRSPALGGRKSAYGIFLPAGWDEAAEDRRWPLVIWLHGMWEDHDRFAERGGGAILDRMTGAGEFGPAVVVCAEGDRSSFWTNGVDEDDAYEDLVVDDLIPHLEERWPVTTERRKRAIAGVSMGGYGALKIALKHPARFGVVAAHSAAVLPEDPDDLASAFPWVTGRGARLVTQVFDDPIDPERWRAESVLHLAATIDRKAARGLRIHFDCGTRDHYGFLRTNRRLHEILAERDIPHTWRPVPDGDHGWKSGYNAEAIPHGLRFIERQWTQERAVKGLGGLFGGRDDKDGGDGGDGDDKDGDDGDEPPR